MVSSFKETAVTFHESTNSFSEANHISSILSCSVCMALVHAVEKEIPVGSAALRLFVGRFCNRFLILAYPCNLIASAIIEKVIAYVEDNLTGKNF